MAMLIGSSWGSDHLCCCCPKVSTACGYLFIHCNNCSINTQYILGEKPVRISQQGRGAHLCVPPSRGSQPLFRAGLSYLTGISAWAEHSPESLPVPKSETSQSTSETSAEAGEVSARKCPIFILVSMLNKKCEKLGIENDTKVKWLLKGYKFH